MEKEKRLYEFLSTAGEYCSLVASARESERDAFIAGMVTLLPRLYLGMMEDSAAGADDEEEEYSFLPSYVDEDYYDAVRRGMEQLLGPDDTFLETFMEDMKYSDTPIAASISESLADIFQDLFNFVSNVRESGGESLEPSYRACRENFFSYWGQTLCNVMRPLNALRMDGFDQNP